MEVQLKNQEDISDFFFVTLDESCDVCDIDQLLVFCLRDNERGADSNALSQMTQSGVTASLDKLGLKWEQNRTID